MSLTTIASPDNLQLQSSLAQLPAEIKHIICALCLETNQPILDPSARLSVKEENGKADAKLGVGLLRTCRRLYHEVDRRLLFAQNVFRFTTVDRMHTFLDSLDASHRNYIQDLEIDLRKLHADQPDIARNWLKAVGSLQRILPGLRTLRLNFESWPKIPMFRTELWNLLRKMLSEISTSDSSLDRIMVIGAGKGSGMARRAPWSPVHFVGGDDVGTDDLVPRLRSVVQGPDELKMIKWVREHGKLRLEVITLKYLLQWVEPTWPGPTLRRNPTDLWPESGSCTVFNYDNRDSAVTEPREKGINPSGAE